MVKVMIKKTKLNYVCLTKKAKTNKKQIKKDQKKC